MSESEIERIKRQLRALEAWVADLTAENRELRKQISEREQAPAPAWNGVPEHRTFA